MINAIIFKLNAVNTKKKGMNTRFLFFVFLGGKGDVIYTCFSFGLALVELFFHWRWVKMESPATVEV